ncbi:MAG: outer membrane protein assembly factor BamC, partial [Rhodoferax sp.]|nr:outer membrane protein assembly factor BamC [Rhodoferax sp.]
EDRDRSKGLYFVRYVPPTDKTEPGFFSKLFGSGNVSGQPLTYRIAVVSRDAATWVSVQTAEGSAVNAAQAQRILKVIADDLQ